MPWTRRRLPEHSDHLHGYRPKTRSGRAARPAYWQAGCLQAGTDIRLSLPPLRYCHPSISNSTRGAGTCAPLALTWKHYSLLQVGEQVGKAGFFPDPFAALPHRVGESRLQGRVRNLPWAERLPFGRCGEVLGCSQAPWPPGGLDVAQHGIGAMQAAWLKIGRYGDGPAGVGGADDPGDGDAGDPPQHTTPTGTCRAAAAARTLTSSAIQGVPPSGAGAMREA